MTIIVMTQLRRKMHNGVERYYRLNRILLKTVGLWPYDQSYLTRIQKVLFTFALVTFIAAQLLVFTRKQYDANIVFKTLSIVLPTMFIAIKYFLFLTQPSKVKRLLERIQDDWNLLKTKLEIDIIEKYACEARYVTIFLMIMCFFAVIVCVLYQYLPVILDVVSPLNESRPYEIIVLVEYFVNEQKYFFVISIHEVICVYIGGAAVGSTFSSILIYIQHACAMFRIASYQIESAIDKNALKVSSPRREFLLYRRIAHAVIIHQRAVEFVDFLTSYFMNSYVILVAIGICCISLNLFQFLRYVTLIKDSKEALMYGMFIITEISYMFLLHYGGQRIIDHGMQLYMATYKGLWYAAPLQTQKLLLFIMQRTAKNVTITCGWLFVMSFETFAKQASSAVSYFMVIYSTQL